MASIAHIIRRRHNRKQRQRRQRQVDRLRAGLIVASITLVVIVPVAVVLGLAGYLYGQAVALMPSPADTIYLDPIIGPTDLFDRAGETLLYSVQDPLGNERVWLDIETLPPYVVEATLQMHDADYLQAGAFNLQHTLTQLWRYILGLRTVPDRSIAGLLTDQTLLPAAQDSGLDAELLHIALSAEVQQRYTPRRVLEWYLNTAYYANDAYGLDAAAHVYFGKGAVDLTLDEAALLAAIPPAPQFNPFDDPTAAAGRQRDLLRNLLNSGLIDQAAFEVAIATETALRPDLLQRPQIAPAFSVYAREQTEDILNGLGLDGSRLVSRGGLRIITTLDIETYDAAACILRAHLAQLNGLPKNTVTSLTGAPCTVAPYLRDVVSSAAPSALPDTGTLFLMDVQTGEVLAMVGEATAAVHQPGPVLHPFAYFSGFLSGNFTPATMVLDIPQPFPGSADGLIYTPVNPDGVYRGPLNLREAMVAGLRPPAAYLVDREGASSVLSNAHSLGLNSLRDASVYDLSLIERGGAVSVLDTTYAYSVFAAMGVMRGVDSEPVALNYRARNPVAVLRIEDAEGNLVWAYDEERRALSRTNILGADLAYLVNDVLSDGATRRTVWGVDDAALQLDRPAAVVNGLTGDAAESWTIGYTPQLAMGIHLGRQDAEALQLDPWGLQGAAPIWQAVMHYAHERHAPDVAIWPQPATIAEYVVCENSGLTPPADSQCPRYTELFLEQVPPTREDTFWRSVRVNSQTRTLATTYTATNLVIDEVYFVPPDAALDWWQSNNLPLPPTEYDTLSAPDLFRAVALFEPEGFSYVGSSVEVRGSIDAENLQFYQLAYGEGITPIQWFEIGEPRTTYTDGQSLGTWDTSALNGIYTLQLAVTYQDNTTDSAFAQVTIDNIAPEIELRTADDNRTVFRWPAETAIPVIALVDDNYAVERVEFFHNGGRIGTDTDWPYGFEHTIEGVGQATFRAVVYDQVGNTSEAEVQVNIIRSGG